jgi:hypothetical protein
MSKSIPWFGAGCLFASLAATAIAGTQFRAADRPATVPRAAALNRAPLSLADFQIGERSVDFRTHAVQVPGRTPSGLALDTMRGGNPSLPSAAGVRGASVITFGSGTGASQADASRPPETGVRKIFQTPPKGP